MKILVVGSGGREHALAWKLAREPGVTRGAVRAGQCRHRARSRDVAADRRRRRRRARRARRARADRSDGRRSRAAARSRHRRSASARAGCASSARRAPPRSSSAARCSRRSSWRATASRPRATACATPPPTRTRVIASRRARLPGRRQGRRPRGRQGRRRRRRIAPTADAADPRGDGGAAVRRRRRARRDRGVPRRSRGVVLRAVRRPARACRSRSAQDHKRVFDDDDGPNTGGMGAFAPSPLIDAALQARVMREIVEPVVAGLRAEGHDVPRVPLRRPDADLRRAEGDRVQRALRRSGSAGRAPADRRAIWRRCSAAAADGALDRDADRVPPRDARRRRPRVRRAIPASVTTGVPIRGLDEAARARRRASCSTPGTARQRTIEVVTAGGRVLTVVGRGADVRGGDRARLRRRARRSRSTACTIGATSAGRRAA